MSEPWHWTQMARTIKETCILEKETWHERIHAAWKKPSNVKCFLSRPNNERLLLTQAPGKWHSACHSCPDSTASEHLMFLFIYKKTSNYCVAWIVFVCMVAQKCCRFCPRWTFTYKPSKASLVESNEKTTNRTKRVDYKNLFILLWGGERWT